MGDLWPRAKNGPSLIWELMELLISSHRQNSAIVEKHFNLENDTFNAR